MIMGMERYQPTMAEGFYGTALVVVRTALRKLKDGAVVLEAIKVRAPREIAPWSPSSGNHEDGEAVHRPCFFFKPQLA
jgi:RNA binding exosome subunit